MPQPTHHEPACEPGDEFSIRDLLRVLGTAALVVSATLVIVSFLLLPVAPV